MKNRRDLIDYINTFEASKGNYSKDELYLIGLAHKQIDKSERDWQWLANYVGFNKTGEAYRCWIKARQKDEGLLKSNDDIQNKKYFSNVEDYKDKVKNRDQLNSIRRVLRDEARIENIIDCIKYSIETLETLPTVKYSGDNKKCDREAVLMVSDLHLGVICDNFYNKYNEDIAYERLNTLADETISYCRLMNVKRLNIVNLGDMIQGLIHVTARIEEQIDVIDQIIKASEMLASFLNRLQLACPEVIYRSVVDNHSRMVANKNEHIEKENFCRIMDWYLQERLRKTSVVFANDNLDEGIGRFYVNDKCVVFAHGHCDAPEQSMQHFMGALGEKVDYVLLGHYHCEKMKSFQGLKAFVNGSIVGTEQYALSKRLFSKPSQTLLVFEKHNDNVINVSIAL